MSWVSSRGRLGHATHLRPAPGPLQTAPAKNELQFVLPCGSRLVFTRKDEQPFKRDRAELDAHPSPGRSPCAQSAAPARARKLCVASMSMVEDAAALSAHGSERVPLSGAALCAELAHTVTTVGPSRADALGRL